MSVLLTIFHYALWAAAIFLLLNCLYLLFFAVMGHRQLPALKPLAVAAPRRMCVLIPAYREDVVILDTTRQAVAHAYNGPAQVIVVADGLQPATLSTLRELGAGVVEVTFERSTKGKALLHALTVLPNDAYDVAVVLDADNIMGHGCLTNINAAFDAGYRVVQTHRTAKNQGTAFAFLDACNEEINNHIYRQGPAAIGLSSALIGSGMAFDYKYLRQLLAGIGETVGEDKELDFRIARDGYKIAYLSRVYTYDEKIENAQVFTQQRTRWLASQVEFLKKYAGEGVRELVRNGNVEFFHKSLQTFLVPRTLLMGVLGLFFVLSWVLPVGPPVVFWAGLLLLLAMVLFSALPGRLYNKQLLQALVRLPYAIWCMCLALLRIRRTKSSFLATPHRVQEPVAHLENHSHHAI